jgi:hypothetical protein
MTMVQSGPDRVIEFAPRGGLLVPVDAVGEPAPVADRRPRYVIEDPRDLDLLVDEVHEPVPPAPDLTRYGVVEAPVDGRPDARRPETAEQVRQRLADKRSRVSVAREDQLERAEEQTDHKLALADVRARAASKRRQLREQVRDEKQDAELAALHRRAAREGTRARIRADIQRSAEMRALRVELVRRSAFVVGLPILIGFAAWSTPGVQAGTVRLLGADPHSPLWWAAWLVEPLLIGVAAWIITIKSLLRNAGGDIDGRATRAKWGALGVSVALNMTGGWHGGNGVMAAIGEALAHSIGAIGAAVTAWLIGVVVDYASNAKPWDGVARLAELDVLPGSRSDAINRGKRGADGLGTDELPDDIRTLLEAVRTAIAQGSLRPDPSAYAIHREVMGGRGDKAKASKVARLVAGWRPPLRAVAQ